MLIAFHQTSVDLHRCSSNLAYLHHKLIDFQRCSSKNKAMFVRASFDSGIGVFWNTCHIQSQISNVTSTPSVFIFWNSSVFSLRKTSRLPVWIRTGGKLSNSPFIGVHKTSPVQPNADDKVSQKKTAMDWMQEIRQHKYFIPIGIGVIVIVAFFIFRRGRN